MITPEQARIIEEAIESALIDVHTMLPGAIEVYNSTTKTASIILQTKRVLEKPDGSLISEELPKLENVPVWRYRTDKCHVSLPIKSGDKGMVFFAETSLDQWRSKGTVTSPSDVERHGLSGAVFVHGFFDNASEISDSDLETHIVIAATDTTPIKIKNSAGDMELKASGQLDVNGNFTVDP